MLQVHSEVLATALAGLQKTERGMSQRRESQDVNWPLYLDKDGDVLETRNRNKFQAERFDAYQEPAVTYQEPAVTYQEPAVSYQELAVSYQEPAVSWGRRGEDAIHFSLLL
jgi:hypothetical protein